MYSLYELKIDSPNFNPKTTYNIVAQSYELASAHILSMYNIGKEKIKLESVKKIDALVAVIK